MIPPCMISPWRIAPDVQGLDARIGSEMQSIHAKAPDRRQARVLSATQAQPSDPPKDSRDDLARSSRDQACRMILEGILPHGRWRRQIGRASCRAWGEISW